jgi:hypothetical protein
MTRAARDDGQSEGVGKIPENGAPVCGKRMYKCCMVSVARPAQSSPRLVQVHSCQQELWNKHQLVAICIHSAASPFMVNVDDVVVEDSPSTRQDSPYLTRTKQYALSVGWTCVPRPIRQDKRRQSRKGSPWFRASWSETAAGPERRMRRPPSVRLRRGWF